MGRRGFSSAGSSITTPVSIANGGTNSGTAGTVSNQPLTWSGTAWVPGTAVAVTAMDAQTGTSLAIGGTTATTLNLGRSGQTQALLGSVTAATDVYIGAATVTPTAGYLKFPNTNAITKLITARGGAGGNVADLCMVRANPQSYTLYFGDDLTTPGTDWSSVVVAASSPIMRFGSTFTVSTTALNLISTTTSNISLVGNSPTYGSGVRVTYIGNATTVPTVTPTAGGILYETGGALTHLGTSGTSTTIAPA